MSPRQLSLDGQVPPPSPGAAGRAGNLLLWSALVLLALGPASGYFLLSFSAMASALQTKAEVKAELITQAISRSPLTWRFEAQRLNGLLVRLPVQQADEHASIVSESGEIIASSSQALRQPVVERQMPLFDAGVPAGQVKMQRSLATLVKETAITGLLSTLLTCLLVAHLLRLQRRAEALAEAISDEQERARVTLHSIGDAVITTDTQERIDYLNPVAERLTGWTLTEARGQPLSRVCTLIDESTMEAVATPVTAALRDGQICGFSGKDVALLRRDGTALAIEDSAAPIHNHEGRLIGGALVFRDVASSRRMAQRISWAATHDSLTGLVNRREFETRVDAALLSAHNSERQHVLCCLDLDQFKIVNDTCGHAGGDELLKQLSGLLQRRLRESDTLARLGGDEFGVLLEGCALDRAQLIANDLLAAVREHRYANDGRTFSVGVSIGLVAIKEDTISRAELFAAADTACYAAKEQGRNRVCIYQSSDADMAQRRSEMNWAARLRGALEEDRFCLYYQPYLALGESSAHGQHIEILIRLLDEAGQLVQPGSFLPAAERYNLMPEIDRWVVRSVFSRYQELARSMGQPLTCAINLSGATLNSEGILDFIHQQASLHQLPPGSICFEVTETAAINNMRKATEFMRSVKTLGFCFALDDFGVGTSSLAYLKTLPVDYLKIDGSFIRNITHDPVDRAMADTINRVGHIMGLQTVGEYAESSAVIDELRLLGVDFAQGYGVQRPQPLPEPGAEPVPKASVPSPVAAPKPGQLALQRD